MKTRHTLRGFQIGEFKDNYNKDCSIQESSLATEQCIWLGIDNPKVMQLIPGRGWVTLDLAKDEYEYIIESRMHLTQDQVAKLLPYLQRFVETGSIFTEDDSTNK